MSNASPYSFDSNSQMKYDATPMGNFELRGLHISTINVLKAAFYDPISYIFKIATLDFSTN